MRFVVSIFSSRLARLFEIHTFLSVAGGLLFFLEKVEDDVGYELHSRPARSIDIHTFLPFGLGTYFSFRRKKK